MAKSVPKKLVIRPQKLVLQFFGKDFPSYPNYTSRLRPPGSGEFPASWEVVSR
jgi:hypothetical protein